MPVLTDEIPEILGHEAPVAIVTSGGAGPVFERTKARFPWCRAALVVRVTSAERLI